MWRELVEIKRKNPGRGGFPNPLVAQSPFYELTVCTANVDIDIPWNAKLLEDWAQKTTKRLEEEEGRKIFGADLEKYAWVQIDELFLRLQQGLFAPQERHGKTPATPPTTAHDTRQGVKWMIEALMKSKLWGVAPAELIRRSEIPASSFYRHLKHPEVAGTWEKYNRESAGKTPAKPEELGDDPTFWSLTADRD
jgi:hypothetical protein